MRKGREEAPEASFTLALTTGLRPGTAEGGCPHMNGLRFVGSDSHAVEGAVDEEERDEEEGDGECVGDHRALIAGQGDG